jgi:hypothetical protein
MQKLKSHSFVKDSSSTNMLLPRKKSATVKKRRLVTQPADVNLIIQHQLSSFLLPSSELLQLPRWLTSQLF